VVLVDLDIGQQTSFKRMQAHFLNKYYKPSVADRVSHPWISLVERRTGTNATAKWQASYKVQLLKDGSKVEKSPCGGKGSVR